MTGHPPIPLHGYSYPKPQQLDLLIEPGAAEQAAKACRELKEKLNERAQTAIHLSRKVDFGQCLEGWALSEKFSLKAKGTPTSAFELMVRAQEILEDMAQAYEAAGRAYSEQERINTAGFTQN